MHHQVIRQRRFRLLRAVEVVESCGVLFQNLRAGRGDGGRAGRIIDPNVEGSAPVALARQSPIDVVAQEIAKPATADVLRKPVNAVVVGQDLAVAGGGSDEPGGTRILDQRVVVGAPAKGVVVAVVLPEDERSVFLEQLDQPPVSLLHSHAGDLRDTARECAIRFDRTQERNGLRLGVACRDHFVQLVVHLAKCRCLMHQSGATVERHELASQHLPKVRFSASCLEFSRTAPQGIKVVVERGAEASPEQGFTFELLFDGKGMPELLLDVLAQGGRQNQAAPRGPYLNVIKLAPHCHVLVGGKGPGGRRPHQQMDIGLIVQRQCNIDRRVLDALVTQPDFPCGQSRAALGPPPDDLMSPVEQTLPEQSRQRPPDALHIRLVVGHVGIRQVNPEANPAGHFFPLLRVAEYRIHALPDEPLDAVFFDSPLAVYAQLLLDLHLDWEPVRVPASLARHVIARHGAVSQEHVLEYAGQHMAVVRQAVRGRRALVEDEARLARPQLEALFEDSVFLPKPAYRMLGLGKVDDRSSPLESPFAHGRSGVSPFSVSYWPQEPHAMPHGGYRSPRAPPIGSNRARGGPATGHRNRSNGRISGSANLPRSAPNASRSLGEQLCQGSCRFVELGQRPKPQQPLDGAQQSR